MSYTAEVKGKAADRFRAYASAKSLRSPTAADHIKRHEAGLPMLEKGAKIRYQVEDVVLEGDVKTDSVSFTAEPGTTITRVVFYKGAVETEAVVGSVEINATGQIDIALIEPPDVAAPAGPQIVDE